MNFYCEVKDGSHQIVVVGEGSPRENWASLLDVMDDEQDDISISFIDIYVLPRRMVEKIAQLKKEKKCKVFVFQKYLYFYLLKLGIECTYVREKSMEHQLITMGRSTEDKTIEEGALKDFLKKLHQTYGVNFCGYDTSAMKRYIKTSMKREKIQGFEKFVSLALVQEDLFKELFLTFSVNTTQFFRNPEVFLALKTIMVDLLSKQKYMKIWCAGCSIGKEPYSLAMLLDELGVLNRVQIYATDINPYVIQEAKNALFSLDTLEEDMENYQAAGGEKSFIDHVEIKEKYLKVKEHLQKNILFFQQNLLHDGRLEEFDLILCRNLFIYLGPDLQQKALENFYNGLCKNGILVLGKAENIAYNNGNRYFKTLDGKHNIYMKK